MDALKIILHAYGLDANACQIQPFGSGLINHTWKISAVGEPYILQRINTNIFKRAQDIADNLQLLNNFLKINHPGYLFAAPLPATNGKYLIEQNQEYYRLLPFIKGSHTLDFLTDCAQAYQAAKAFGKFTYLLDGFAARHLKYTLPDFHNLNLRIQQFDTALAEAAAERINQSQNEIAYIKQHLDIANIYDQIVANKEIPLRVIHHDTKINNVLFDAANKQMAVIDLDTVMPGYCISDIGDMLRTYLSEANEEEQDLNRIIIRESFFKAIYQGYTGQMGAVLTGREKQLFIYSGKFMIYMQALRFLTDFLNGDIYYQTKYPGHNLMRAKNQLCLLQKYIDAEPAFEAIIAQF